MRINYLKVSNYKNLKTKAIFGDIGSCANYLTLIGLNGSGKSNVLEAISLIFASLYKRKTTPFRYDIRYSVKGKSIKVVNGKYTENRKEVKRDYDSCLPDQVIACYSGEERRLWEDVYEDFHNSYISDVIDGKRPSFPQMLYLDKRSWGVALIALMCSEKQSVISFLIEMLGINVDESIEVLFSFDTDKYTLFKSNEVLGLINRINPNKEKQIRISINELRSYNIGQADNSDYVKKVFYYLYNAYLPEKNSIVKVDKIILNIDIALSKELSLKSISEGDKKLLLIECIIDVLGDENTLFLFDEPDAHLHISRKQEVEKILDKENYFSIITTHSPTLFQCSKEENARIIANGEKGIEVRTAEKLKDLDKLTGGVFSIVDATIAFATTKDILLVEGTTDYLYISKAIEVLKGTKSPKYDTFELAIINCGSAGNIAHVLEQAILPCMRKSQLCIAVFDNDKAGTDGKKSVDKLIVSSATTSVQAMFYPKTPLVSSSGKFEIEDYYPITAYKPYYNSISTAANTYEELMSVTRPKKLIETHYTSFTDSDYDNFQILLDEIARKQAAFHV